MLTPIARGSLIAVVAAALFGLTTPLVTHFGRGIGPFTTAALLYAGAALAAGLPGRASGPRVGRAELGRVAAVALFGALLAPASLAWGLQNTGALSASLLLNLEAVFTVALAAILYREPVGRRVMLAVGLMLAGGALLALRSQASGGASLLGVVAVLGASLGWALDNTLTRPLSDFDPRGVVLGKAVIGSALALATAAVLGEPLPSWSGAAGIFACGATGYGLSLRLYLGAQRILGAARTGSLFAFAPFVGAALAFALGDRQGGLMVAGATLLFASAVYLHVTEKHAHVHHHEAVEHDHPHRHDDLHHDHTHDPPFVGEHSHPHRHAALEHSHEHGSDLHHQHAHQ
ncbi:MAG: EamA family transporter [Myxococcales bacterium]|nr:EamA family transporter [Myxococcales bacterium]